MTTEEMFELLHDPEFEAWAKDKRLRKMTLIADAIIRATTEPPPSDVDE
jgi:hypothetical protein